MNDQDWLAERFEANRSHLRGVAFRMLGSSVRRTTPSRGVDPPEPHRYERCRQPSGLVDNGRRAGLAQHAAVRRTRRESSLDTHVPHPS